MPRGMGRGRGAVEKPKDFGGVMKKLVKFCSRYIPVMIFALVLGAAGTVCQIIGPDKLTLESLVGGLHSLVLAGRALGHGLHLVARLMAQLGRGHRVGELLHQVGVFGQHRRRREAAARQVRVRAAALGRVEV